MEEGSWEINPVSDFDKPKMRQIKVIGLMLLKSTRLKLLSNKLDWFKINIVQCR